MDPRSAARRTAPGAALLLALVTLPTGCLAGRGGVVGTPGAAGVRDPYFPRLGNGGYDVAHYDLDLRIDGASGRLSGTAVITARATQDLSAFNLDLAGLEVRSVTVEGRPAAVNRAGAELTLRPDRPVADRLRAGRTFRTVVRYDGEPRTVTDADGSEEGWLRTAKGTVALGEPAGSPVWFPGNHHPSDKATYDVRITVPEGRSAVSNGELASRRTAGGRTTFRWVVREPMASSFATVAVGPYEVRRTVTADGLPVITAVDPEVAGRTPALPARISEVVAWGVKHFGPYPFSSAGAIVGMPGDAGYALETQNRPFFPGPPDSGLLVHELAHQWFGDSVTPRTWRDMWLSEGFATYAEWLWSEEHDGVPVEESFGKAYADEANWAFPAARPPGPADLSRPPVYGRGAMVVHRIRQEMGDDEAFFGLVRGWLRAHRHGNASTDDFTAYVEEESGLELTVLHEVWETWLNGGSRPARG